MENKIYTTNEIKEIITPVIESYGIKKLAIFGSYAKGEASPQSDIDFHLIDVDGTWGYFKLCGFKQELEDFLGVPVDVLTTGAMDDEIYEKVRESEILIYG